MSNESYQPGQIDREPHIARVMEELKIEPQPGMRVLIVDPLHSRMPKWFAVRQCQVDVACRDEQRTEQVHCDTGEGINVFRMPPSSFLAGCSPQTYDLIVAVDWTTHPDKLDLLAQGRKALRWEGRFVIVCPETSEAGRLEKAVEWDDSYSYAAGLVLKHRAFVWRKEMGWLLSSYPRCGTHMLITALEQHPELSCLGEVFNPNHPAGMHGLKDTRQVLEASWVAPQYGFAQHCYISRTGGCPNMQSPRKLFSGLWNHMPTDCRTVVVRRRNLLARHVSHLKANQTKVWFGNHAGPNRKPVRVDPARLLKDIAFVKECWLQQDEHFKVKYVLWYEDLITHWPEIIREVQSFLGVKPTSIEPTTTKLGRSLREDIENFGQLRKALVGQIPDEWFKE